MADRIRIAIITATNSKTSTGSNNTVLNLLDNLDSDKYLISIVLFNDLIPDRLAIAEDELRQDPTYVAFAEIKNHSKVSNIYSLSSLSLKEIKNMFDFAIVAIYNEFGEDGKTLGLLELVDIPYLSPKLKSSVLAFDKSFTKAILASNGLLVPKSSEINKENQNEKLNQEILPRHSYPLIVKPTSNGASRGTTLVKSDAELQPAIEKAFAFSDEVILEEFIAGQEFSVGVIGPYNQPTALPVVMIKSKNEFFDYEAKYVAGVAEEICPAPISQELEAKLQQAAIKTYQALKAENHARIDFPGLLRSSIFPKELTQANISLAEFLDRSIVEKLKNK